MKNILLLQTGGTIAMSTKAAGNEFDSESWNSLLHQQFPELKALANIDTIPLFSVNSSDLNSTHWIKLAETIEKNYEKYDGFVILHGTDTMAYTASALSFGLQNLKKPVVLTGSQLPMSNVRSDGKRNLINAVEIAKSELSEVVICFNNHVFRGNRASKRSISDFDAFHSPNFPALAELGAEITLTYGNQIHSEQRKFKNSSGFSNELLVLTVFPSMKTDFLNTLDLSGFRAVILQAFGSGNLPMIGENSLLPFIEKCVGRNIVTAVGSQTFRNRVNLNKYPPGRKAEAAGAVSCGDMTPEASITKMMYLLAHHRDNTEIERLYMRNLAGELAD